MEARRAIRIALIVLFALVAAWYLTAHGEEFYLLLDLDARYLPPLLLVALAAIAANGLITRLLVLQFGVRLDFREWFGLTVLHAFGNYMPFPQAGAVARGIYLKKVRGLDYSSFTATLVATYVQFLATVGTLGLLALAFLALAHQPVPRPLWIPFATLATMVVLLTPIVSSLPLIRRWSRFVEGMAKLRRRHILLAVAGCQTVLIAAGTTGMWLAFRSLDRPVAWTGCLLLALLIMVSASFRVTPGNLGVAESAAWMTAYVIGTNADEAVVAFALFRLVSVVTIFGLTPYYALRLSPQRRNGKADSVQETPS